MNTENFIKLINKMRLNNRDGWYSITGIVNGKEFRLKGYKTWLQIFTVNGIDFSNPMEGKVKDFKATLEKGATS